MQQFKCTMSHLKIKTLNVIKILYWKFLIEYQKQFNSLTGTATQNLYFNVIAANQVRSCTWPTAYFCVKNTCF